MKALVLVVLLNVMYTSPFGHGRVVNWNSFRLANCLINCLWVLAVAEWDPVSYRGPRSMVTVDTRSMYPPFISRVARRSGTTSSESSPVVIPSGDRGSTDASTVIYRPSTDRYHRGSLLDMRSAKCSEAIYCINPLNNQLWILKAHYIISSANHGNFLPARPSNWGLKFGR